jgi:hypothetical protein
MRLPRFTIRRLMLVVALSACAIVIVRSLWDHGRVPSVTIAFARSQGSASVHVYSSNTELRGFQGPLLVESDGSHDPKVVPAPAAARVTGH